MAIRSEVMKRKEKRPGIFWLSVNLIDADLVITNNTGPLEGEAPKRVKGFDAVITEEMREIIFTEECSYGKPGARFPVRTLKVKLNVMELSRFISCKSIVDATPRRMYSIEVTSGVLESTSSSSLVPTRQSKFKAFLKNDDILMNAGMMAANPEAMMELNMNPSTELEFVLFHESELDFGLSSVNFYLKNTELSKALLYGFQVANPSLKILMSELGHNPIIPHMMIQPMTYTEFFSYLDSEFGFFRTPYMKFVEYGICYMLNMDNDVKASYKKLSNTIVLDMTYLPGQVDSGTHIAFDNNESYLRFAMSGNNVKITRDSKQSIMRNDPCYIFPDGSNSINKTSSSRNIDTVQKTTSIPHIISLVNNKIELIKFNKVNTPGVTINPLTKIQYTDNLGIVRYYRLYSKRLTVVNANTSNLEITGFRNI